MFIWTCHMPLPWARWIQSVPCHPLSLKFILILSSCLHLGIPSGLFLSCFPQQNLVCTFPPIYMPQAMPTSSSLIWLSQFTLTHITETPSPSLEFWCNDENWIGHRNVRWFKLPDGAVSVTWFYWIMLPWQLQDIIFISSHPATHHLSDISQNCLVVTAPQKKHKLLLTLLVEHKMTISTAWCGWHSSINYVSWIQPTYTTTIHRMVCPLI